MKEVVQETLRLFFGVAVCNRSREEGGFSNTTDDDSNKTVVHACKVPFQMCNMLPMDSRYKATLAPSNSARFWSCSLSRVSVSRVCCSRCARHIQFVLQTWWSILRDDECQTIIVIGSGPDLLSTLPRIISAQAYVWELKTAEWQGGEVSNELFLVLFKGRYSSNITCVQDMQPAFIDGSSRHA